MPKNGVVEVSLACGHTVMFHNPAPANGEITICFRCPRGNDGLTVYQVVTNSPFFQNYKWTAEDESYQQPSEDRVEIKPGMWQT